MKWLLWIGWLALAVGGCGGPNDNGGTSVGNGITIDADRIQYTAFAPLSDTDRSEVSLVALSGAVLPADALITVANTTAAAERKAATNGDGGFFARINGRVDDQLRITATVGEDSTSVVLSLSDPLVELDKTGLMPPPFLSDGPQVGTVTVDVLAFDGAYPAYVVFNNDTAQTFWVDLETRYVDVDAAEDDLVCAFGVDEAGVSRTTVHCEPVLPRTVEIG